MSPMLYSCIALLRSWLCIVERENYSKLWWDRKWSETERDRNRKKLVRC